MICGSKRNNLMLSCFISKTSDVQFGQVNFHKETLLEKWQGGDINCWIWWVDESKPNLRNCYAQAMKSPNSMYSEKYEPVKWGRIIAAQHSVGDDDKFV